MSKNRVFYMVMTDNEDLARDLWGVVECYRHQRWWKRVTKYYRGDEPEPYYETTEASSPAAK